MKTTSIIFTIFFGFSIISCQSPNPENQPTTEALPSNPILQEQKIEAAVFDNNTILLHYITQNGDTLKFYTDTGGGNIIYPEGVEKLNLPIEAEGKMRFVKLDSLFKSRGLPYPIRPQFLYSGERQLKTDDSGILGTNWFANKIWRFDYINQELFLVDSINWSAFDEKHVVKVGFMEDSLGNHITHFPSIDIIVEGDTISTLFDTGAQATLNEEASTIFNNEKRVGTSFIIASIFDKWVVEHPEWQVINGGDAFLEEDLIEVPKVTIGNHEVGPVWFARRKDTNFTEYMSQWMDKTVQGAVGGSCFQYFSSVVIDYKSEQVFFKK